MINHQTQALYAQSRKRGQWNRFRTLLTGRSADMFNLADIETNYTVRKRRYAGVQTVSIQQIQGSENRTGDFDRDLNPLRDHNRQRWQNIAALWLDDQGLPLVDLIQVGEVYFVRDGHHRLSVARALGQEDIDAEVTVWQVDESLPWQEPSITGYSKTVNETRLSWAEQLRLSLGQWLTTLGNGLKIRPRAEGTTAGR